MSEFKWANKSDMVEALSKNTFLNDVSKVLFKLKKLNEIEVLKKMSSIKSSIIFDKIDEKMGKDG